VSSKSLPAGLTGPVAGTQVRTGRRHWSQRQAGNPRLELALKSSLKSVELPNHFSRQTIAKELEVLGGQISLCKP
jgi:hypothetical protein